MIFTFFIGFIFSLVGQLGSDTMNILSYILSEDNLGENGDNFLSGKIGKYKKYINTCINEEGDIQTLVNIDGEVLDAFVQLYSAEALIDNYMSQFGNIPKIAYTYAHDKIEDMHKFDLATDDFGYILNERISDNPSPKLYYQESLNSINSDSDNTGYKGWSSTCELNTCGSGQSCYKLRSSCDIEENVVGEKAKANAQIIIALDTLIENEYSESDGYKKIIEDLGKSYTNFINTYTDVLTTAKTIIHSITVLIRDYTGEDGGFFSIVNCKFIGKHLKVLLDNLKSSLGGSVKTVGICLSVVGCSLILSISSTILLIVIINKSIEEDQKTGQSVIPEYPVDSAGRTIAYKNI